MSDTELRLNDIPAIDRTRMAAECTLMAWARTTISLITFTFSTNRVVQAHQEQPSMHALRSNARRNTRLTDLMRDAK
jgi:uncharacterized membrane protein YidH (DUF202 family)